jgi:hypothetical protein
MSFGYLKCPYSVNPNLFSVLYYKKGEALFYTPVDWSETSFILTKTNSVALSPQANYTDWATTTCRQNSVPTFVDRGVSRGQRGGSPTVVNLSFLDRSRYFPFK